jgi:hypothetical protein
MIADLASRYGACAGAPRAAGKNSLVQGFAVISKKLLMGAI